ncbi:MAG TPA: cell envelope integrity protein CreD [Stellaceae bacterium]|nr:cell envelope integrity protein CreD [Stellaceae bacterium]
MSESTSEVSIGAPAQDTPSGLARLMAAPALKAVMIGGLLLLMLIPLQYVSAIIQEREARQAEVVREFQRSWGPAQSVTGPILVVPYWTSPDKPRRYLHVAPSEAKTTVQLTPELRKRGLFHSVVYTAAVRLSGAFVMPPDVAAPDGAALLWPEAFVVLTASDLRALKSTASLSWSGRALPWSDCPQMADGTCGDEPFVVARPALAAPPAAGRAIPFDTQFELRGTSAFRFAPIGQEVDLALSAPWPTPSFVGAILPATSRVTADAFEAAWHVSSNVATGRAVWSSSSVLGGQGWRQPEDQIGVELLEAVPTYQMVDRASKYAILFLALSFLTYFLFELVSRARIHFVQYGMMGASIALFSLLLISLSEPLGFEQGYAISSALILLQASLYTAAVTRRWGLALKFLAILAALFGFLYVVLTLETYSLVTGSLALFVTLSLVMVVTRRLDWSGPRAELRGPAVEAGLPPA